MLLDELKNQYSRLEETDISSQLKFVQNLVKNNDYDTIEFHYSLLRNRTDERFYQSLRSAFKKRKKEGIKFLLNKINHEKDPELLGDVILLLGNLKCKDVLQYIYNFIKSEEFVLRYKSIIVLGWIGSEKDISLMSHVLSGDKDSSIRGYAATAMRQMWYRLSNIKDEILIIFKQQLIVEEDEKVISYILLCVQEIAGINLGIKEDPSLFKHGEALQNLKEQALNCLK